MLVIFNLIYSQRIAAAVIKKISAAVTEIRRSTLLTNVYLKECKARNMKHVQLLKVILSM